MPKKLSHTKGGTQAQGPAKYATDGYCSRYTEIKEGQVNLSPWRQEKSLMIYFAENWWKKSIISDQSMGAIASTAPPLDPTDANYRLL